MASLSPARVLSGDRKKAEWNPWWILGWYVTSIGWIAYGLWARDFSRGITAFVAPVAREPRLVASAEPPDPVPRWAP